MRRRIFTRTRVSLSLSLSLHSFLERKKRRPKPDEVRSSSHRHHHSTTIKSRRWGRKNKENVPLPRFHPAYEYSSRRKKPYLSSRLVWDVTREDRRPARRSPPFGGFRRPAWEYTHCVYKECFKSACVWIVKRAALCALNGKRSEIERKKKIFFFFLSFFFKQASKQVCLL